jgi:hypothetical protein
MPDGVLDLYTLRSERDNTIPRGFFGVLEPKHGIRRTHLLFTGTLALAGGFLMS